jgi:hypothetical protein
MGVNPSIAWRYAAKELAVRKRRANLPGVCSDGLAGSPFALVGRMVLDPDFVALLAGLESERLDEDSSPLVGVWSDLRIAYTNRAWHEHTRNAAFHTLGRSIVPALPPDAAEFLAGPHAHAQTIRPHAFEFVADDERASQLLVYSLARAGFLLVIAKLYGDDAAPDEAPYRNHHGFMMQCAHCRRVRAVHEVPGWDAVPGWAKQPRPQTSHGICYLCFEIYFPYQ